MLSEIAELEEIEEQIEITEDYLTEEEWQEEFAQCYKFIREDKSLLVLSELKEVDGSVMKNFKAYCDERDKKENARDSTYDKLGRDWAKMISSGF